MLVKNLASTPINDLIDCFLKAFEGYFVPMPIEYSYFKNRWETAGVDFNYSYGMFDDNRLVGFIIHATDTRNGKKIAFNTGTGVIPEYRGQKVTQQIYDIAVSDLKKNGFTHSALEVICENEPAIKAYERVGFRICKKYYCFSGTFSLKKDRSIQLKQVGFTGIQWDNYNTNYYYCWDHQKETLQNSNYSFYQVFHGSTKIGFFVIDVKTGTVSQFETVTNTDTEWYQLFQGIQEVNHTLKINNVADHFKTKLKILNTLGLQNSVNQFEMEKTI